MFVIITERLPDRAATACVDAVVIDTCAVARFVDPGIPTLPETGIVVVTALPPTLATFTSEDPPPPEHPEMHVTGSGLLDDVGVPLTTGCTSVTAPWAKLCETNASDRAIDAIARCIFE